MEKKSKKTDSPNVQFYLYPEDRERLNTVLARENLIATENGKDKVTLTGELSKITLKYIDRMEAKHSEMNRFRPK